MSVIINGGGISGIILALALSYLTDKKLKIDLIMPYSPDVHNYLSFDKRSIVLTWGSCCSLLSIGVWQSLSPYSTSIREVEISYYSQLSKILITAHDCKLTSLGYVIELYSMGIILFNLLRKLANVKLHCPATLKQVKREENRNLVILNDNSVLISKLLVAADGPCSPLATSFGINWNKHDYEQIAVISNITTTLSPNGRAFEKFTEYGSIALLPIFNNKSALIWCCSKKFQKDIASWNTEYFCRILQFMIGWSLGHILDASNRYFYPLHLLISNNHISHRLALIGNAAQTLHPIAGQNLNIGLRDAFTLARILAAADMFNKDIGDYTVLSEYQESRKLDQIFTANLTNNLVYLFTNECHALIALRNLSLLAISHSPFLHKLLSKYCFSWILR